MADASWSGFTGELGTDITSTNAKKWSSYSTNWAYTHWLIDEDVSYPYLGVQENDFSGMTGQDGSNITPTNAKKWESYSPNWTYTHWIIEENITYPYLGIQQNDFSGMTGEDGTDITDANARLEASYTDNGWNFTTIWTIYETYSYPWVLNAPCVITDDRNYKKFLNQGIRATWFNNDTNTYDIVKNIGLDLSTYADGTLANTNDDYIGFTFYISNRLMFQSTTYCTVKFESSAGHHVEHDINISNHTIVDGWNKTVFKKNDMVETGNINWANVANVYFSFPIASGFLDEYISLGVIGLAKYYARPTQDIKTTSSPSFSGTTFIKDTEPSSSPNDQITLFATTDTDTSFGIRTEASIVSATPTADYKLPIKINGTLYYILLATP